jgi:hypothetical protein
MVLIGFIIILLGGVVVIGRSLSSGEMSMSGILDRLRLSYPDRSGKEVTQVLNAFNLLLIIIGTVIVIFGSILPPTTRTIKSFF